MSEMKEYVSVPQEMGTIHISEEVIASIAAVSAAEVEGVHSIVGGRDYTDKLGNTHKVSPGKGVHLQIEDDVVTVELSIVVDSAAAVRKIAEQVQEAVIEGIRDMTGLTVHVVNVHVTGIDFG